MLILMKKNQMDWYEWVENINEVYKYVTLVNNWIIVKIYEIISVKCWIV